MPRYVFSVEELFDFSGSFLQGVENVLCQCNSIRKLLASGKTIGSQAGQLEDLEALTISCKFAREIYLELATELQRKLAVALRSRQHGATDYFATLVEAGEIPPFTQLRDRRHAR